MNDAEGSLGRIVAMGIARDSGGEILQRDAVDLVAGAGIRGDRYAEGGGTWKGYPDSEITLVEAEAAEAAGVRNPLLLRRNVVTRGLRLETLIGRRFAVGEALLEGVRLCDPCSYLEGLLAPGLKHRLEGRGGLRARVLRGGRVRVSDRLIPVGPASGRPAVAGAPGPERPCRGRQL